MPGSFRFEPCPNCCVTGCVYESDDFSGTLAKWTETAGSWAIVSAAVDTSDADAVLTCDTLHPTPSNKYIVSVTVKFTTDGDVARVYVGDSDYFAEVERITSSCGRLRLYDNTDVTPVCMGSVGVSLSTWTRLVVCSEEDKVHVGTGGSPMLTVPSTVASSIVALGTGSCTGTVSFEDFSLSKHYEDDNTCPSCGDEGCIWFSDSGCASGSLSVADYSTTGTWAYSTTPVYGSTTSITCTSDGTLTWNVTHPLPSQKTVAIIAIGSPGRPLANDGATATISFGGAASVVASVESGVAVARLYKSGIQYGRTIANSTSAITLVVCWDGAMFSAVALTASLGVSTVGVVADTIASVVPAITVASLSSGKTLPVQVTLRKHVDDLAWCSWWTGCGVDCAPCAGTFANHATVTIANITSASYPYCSCTNQTIDLYATATGCQWTGSTTGPCSSGTWTATATITAVSGGYKLTVTLTTTSGAGATWENTVLSGSPVDCLTAFDGDVPWVSATGSGNCTFGSATCTFATP